MNSIKQYLFVLEAHHLIAKSLQCLRTIHIILHLLFRIMVCTIYLYNKFLFQTDKVGYIIVDNMLPSKPNTKIYSINHAPKCILRFCRMLTVLSCKLFQQGVSVRAGCFEEGEGRQRPSPSALGGHLPHDGEDLVCIVTHTPRLQRWLFINTIHNIPFLSANSLYHIMSHASSANSL